jgi:hypothetical protein
MNYVWSLDCSPMLGSRVQALLFCKYWTDMSESL